MQRLGGQITDALRIRHDARKLRASEGAEDFIIVHAQNRNLLRYGQAHPLAGVQDGAAAPVIACQDGNRFGQGLEPGLQSLLVLYGVLAIQIHAGIALIGPVSSNCSDQAVWLCTYSAMPPIRPRP